MSNGIGHNTLNDISKVYLSQVAEQTEADEYLETVSKVKKVENEDDKKRWAVDEAVKGQDTQDRKDAAAERSRGVGKLLPKKEGESYAKWTMAKDKWVKRKKGEIDEDKQYGYDKDGNSLNPVDIEKRKRKEDDLFGSPIKKEGYSSWRTDLREIIDDSPMTDVESEKEIKEKKVKNKVKTSAMGGGIKIGEAIADLGGELPQIDEVDEVVEGKVASAVGGGVGSAVGGVGGALAGSAAGGALGAATTPFGIGAIPGALTGAAVGGKVGGAVGGGAGAALGAKKGRKKSAAVAGAGGSLVAGPVGSAVGGAIASQYEPEGEQLDELVGGAGTLVRQGVKVGGKKGGRAVQKGTTAATQAAKGKVAQAQKGNPSKMVGTGRGEKIGATEGGLAGGVAGALIPDGPAMVAGEIAGGYAGSKIGGKIGRQFDKMGAKKEEFEVIGEVKVTKLDDKKKKEDRDKKVKAMFARQAEWERGKKKALHASYEPEGGEVNEGEKTPAQKAATAKYEKIKELTNKGKHQEASKLYNATTKMKEEVIGEGGLTSLKATTYGMPHEKRKAIIDKYKKDQLKKGKQPVKAPIQKEEVVDEAKVDAGKTPHEKETIRNQRNTPPGANTKFDTSVFITRKSGESPTSARGRKRREAHAAKRGVKEEIISEKDLNAAERRALPDKDFALPGKGEGPQGKQAGSYPIPDKSHARMALAMVAKHGTPEKKAKVRSAVEKKFPGIKVSEDKAFDTVVSMLRKKHGESGVLTKDSPKPKPQPKAKPQPQKPLSAKEKAQREEDARYGRTPWIKKGSLGT